jgi:superfamily II DNA or RNA helicase
MEEFVNQPCFMLENLYYHQKQNIHYMKVMEQDEDENETFVSKVGFLSDPTGYGKTLSVLGFLRSVKPVNVSDNIKLIVQEDGNEWMYEKKETIYRQKPISIIIIPSILEHQWRKEIEKSGVKAYYISRKKALDFEWSDMNDYDVICVHDTLFSLFSSQYGNVYWERYIIDEPHVCKNLTFDRLKNSRFVWLVTATPYDTMKRYKKVFDVNHSEKIIIRHSKEELKQSIELPKIVYHDYMTVEPIHKICKKLLSKHQYELLKNKNYDMLFHSLGYKKMEQKNLFEILQKRSEKYKTVTYEECLKELEDYTCPICANQMTNICATSCCYNFFCKDCLVPLPNKACPMCRKPFSENNLIELDIPTEHIPTKKTYTLYNVLSLVLPKIGDHVIVYSENVHLKYFLKEMMPDYTFYELHGKIEEKIRALESFRENKSILFLNSILYTSGLNLEIATDVILCEELSESVETQIVGRAYRTGRTTELNVYRIF